MCDGNHYLYYYREDYRRAWEERITHDTLRTGATVRRTSAGSAALESAGFARADRACQRQRRDCYWGVDPTPINEIARELPLSRQLRPEWDVETLTRLGLREIQVMRLEQPLTYIFILCGVR